MSLRIKEINVKNLGPIERLSAKLGAFNLIYGQNEKGKTYLVEFLVRSLFRNTKEWTLRAGTGSGKIIAEAEGKTMTFSPSTAKKIEDLWEKTSPGLPPDFSRLLVVKGAEVDLSTRSGGIDKAVLKKYLSSKEILDAIDDRIPKTIQKADIEQSIIRGNKQGELRTREELADRMKKIGQLFYQIDRGYSGGRKTLLEDKMVSLEIRLNDLERAKRHLAFRLSENLKRLEKSNQRLSDEILMEARETLRIYKQKLEEYKQKKEKQLEAEEKSRHHEWLSSASSIYQEYLEREPVRQPLVFLIVGILMLVGAGVLTMLDRPLYALGALAGLVISMFLYIQKIRGRALRSAESAELEKLEKEYRERFGEELTGLAIIRERLHHMDEDYGRARLLKDQLYGELRTIESLKLKLTDQIAELCGQKIEPEDWEQAIRRLGEKKQELRQKSKEMNVRLASLNVDASDFEKESPGTDYSQQAYQECREAMESVERKIEEENRNLYTLKQRICDQTGDDFAIRWDTLIQNLREKQIEVTEEYKKKTAEVLGKIIVHRVLQGLQRDEDSKIIDGLQSDYIMKPLELLTHRYTEVKLEEDTLKVSDAFHDFRLEELSTGAREQVLLALRIGFAMKLLKQESLFLILDDAFQYSDWERRVWLMDMMVRLAGEGWQIIYFTMDDHIKQLFESKGKSFGREFKLYSL